MPLDYPKSAQPDFEGDDCYFTLGKDLYERIKEITSQTGTTLYMFLLAAYHVLLSKYCDQNDIIIGTPVAGRTHNDLENVVGMFVNTVPIRNVSKLDMTFSDFLNKVKTNVIQAFENQDYQLDMLVEKLTSEKMLDTNQLYQTMFVLQNYDMSEEAIQDVQLKGYEFSNKISKADFSLYAAEAVGDIKFCFVYCTRILKLETVKRISKHYVAILKNICNDIDKKLRNITMMEEDEKRQILSVYNATIADYPSLQTLPGLFLEQVKKDPEAIAAVFGEKSITYQELNRKSEALAYELRQKGVTRDSIIGIIVKRSLEMIIGIHGILKAGGAYLPINPDTPEERLNYIVKDSGMKLAVTQTRYYDRCGMISEVINLEDDTIYEKKVEPIEIINQPRDLAYVIYTSGSTGNPKGVMIEHTSVINRINWMQKKYVLTKDDVILQKTPFTFDVSVWEIFWWMFVGAKVCLLIPEAEKNPEEIIKAVEENKVTVMHFVPSMLSIFLEYVKVNKEENRITCLSKVFASGEALTVDHVKRFNQILNKKNHKKLYNLYGPTEATVDVTYFDCPQEGEISTIPIGKPIDNIKIYILDSEERLQPKGIPGEICIAGVGVGRGYLNKPELTMQKFTKNPFDPEERMYKTGDLGRWMEDGNIEYLGRNDFQVKIRGFRIELGEIEKQLLKCESVKEAVVLAKNDKTGEKYICAYVIGSEPIVDSELKAKLSKVLPDYMIPSFFIHLDTIPLTSSGKVNRKELLSIDEKIQQETKYVAPESDFEKQLEAIWCEVLDIDHVGVNDDFFDIGGQSLLTIKLEVVMESHGLHMDISDIYNYRTIRELAKYVSDNKQQEINLDNIKMTKNKIGNIELAVENVPEHKEIGNIGPFNDIFYQSCFYNSLFPVIRHFDASLCPLMANDIVIYTCEKEDFTGFDIEYFYCKTIGEIYAPLGLTYSSINESSDIVMDVIESINNDRPAIIWVDSFYENIRFDMYQKEHLSHTLLIYGYDSNRNIFNIVEHKHKDSLIYEKREITFDSLKQCSQGYIENYAQYNNPILYTFYRMSTNDNSNMIDIKEYYMSYIYNRLNNQSIIDESMKKLKRFSEQYKETIKNQEALDLVLENITSILTHIINAKRVEKYKLKLFGIENVVVVSIIDTIINDWEYIRSILLRYYYSTQYNPEALLKTEEKIEQIYILEKQYNEYFTYIAKIQMKS